MTSAGEWWDEFVHAGGYDQIEAWLGGVDHPSRTRIRERVAECHYESVLDCGAGLGLDAITLSNIDAYDVRYAGVEPSEAMRDAAETIARRFQRDPAEIVAGSIEEIPFADSEFDLVYCRHVFEHLPRIDQAAAEMVRCARLEVVVVFFMRPGKETHLTRERDGLWQNWWSKDAVEEAFAANPKVEVWFWETLGSEVLFHAYLEAATAVDPVRVAERLGITADEENEAALHVGEPHVASDEVAQELLGGVL